MHAYVELEYARSVYASAICVYETHNAGAVSRIAVRNEVGEWQTVYAANDPKNLHRSRIFRPPIERPSFQTNAVRIELNQSVAAYINWYNRTVQIDTVALCGYDDDHVEEVPTATTAQHDDDSCASPTLIRQFLRNIIASSCHLRDEEFAVKRLAGRPAVYPRKLHKVDEASWCAGQAGLKEFVEADFEQAVHVVAVEIFETWNAGGVSQVALRNPQGGWVTVYMTEHIEQIKQPRRFIPQIQRTSWKTNAIRIEIDPSATVGGDYSQSVHSQIHSLCFP